MITKESTRNMTKEQWEADRQKRTTIGGSDAAAVMGMSKYKSSWALWLEKTGKAQPEDISGKLQVRLGNELEDFVARLFTEETGKKVHRDNHIVTNDRFPFAHANFDRIVVGEKAGLECKTTSQMNLKRFNGGEFPDEYYCQCVHYLAVSGYDRWYLAVLIGNSDFKWFCLERNEEEIAALMDAEKRFADHVESVTPPEETDGSDSCRKALEGYYKPVTDEESNLAACDLLLRNYLEAGKIIDEMKAKQDEIRNQICSQMETSVKGRSLHYNVSWKPQVRKTFDKKAWEKDNGPIHPKYYTESESRPFKVTERKDA